MKLCVGTHTLAPSKPSNAFSWELHPLRGLGSAVGSLCSRSRCREEQTEQAVHPSCSWLGDSRVGRLSEVIALEGASGYTSKLCSVVKHLKFLLSVYQHVRIIRCAAGLTPVSSTWLLGSAEAAIWLQCPLSLWPRSNALYASSETCIKLKMIFRASVCL